MRTKRFLSILACLALTLTLIPAAALPVRADEEPVRLSVTVRGQGTVQIGDNPVSRVGEGDTRYYPRGSIVTLRATPAEGWRLAYWFNGVTANWTGTPGSRELTVEAYQDGDCIAEFVPVTGEYSAEWLLGGDDGDYDMSCTDGVYSVDCGVASVGYGEQEWKTVCVHNTSEDGYLLFCYNTPLRFEAVGDGSAVDWFECESSSNALVDKNGTFQIRVRPKAGLPVGTYAARMIVQEACDPGVAPPLSATVTFTVTNHYVVTTVVDGGKGGTVTGGGAYVSGASVTLTATPDANYAFDRWERADGTVSTANPLKFTALQAETVTAYFKRTAYTICVSSDPGVGGVVKNQNGNVIAGSTSYANGTRLTLTAFANPGWVFTGWTDNGYTLAPDDASRPETVTVTANPDHDIAAHFSLPRVGGRFIGGKLVAAVAAPADSLLIAASYDAERLLDVKVFDVTAPLSGTHAFDALRPGNRYRLMLVNAAAYAPLCEAWYGAP